MGRNVGKDLPVAGRRQSSCFRHKAQRVASLARSFPCGALQRPHFRKDLGKGDLVGAGSCQPRIQDGQQPCQPLTLVCGGSNQRVGGTALSAPQGN